MKLHTRRKGALRAIIAAGAALGIGAVVTLASYTDNASFRATFKTGSLDITLTEAEDQGKPTPYEFSVWGSLNMQPGDDLYAPLQVNNSGTLDFAYTMGVPAVDQTGNAELRAFLTGGVVVVADAASCGRTGFDAAEGADIVVADGTNIEQMSFTQGRELAAATDTTTGESEILCFKAELGTGPGVNASQGQTVTPIFTLQATQVSR